MSHVFYLLTLALILTPTAPSGGEKDSQGWGQGCQGPWGRWEVL